MSIAQRPSVQDQAAFLGDRDELGRADLAAVLVLPARQRLEAGDLARLQVDQRLVEELQLVLVERAAKLGLDREAAPRRARLLRLVDLRLARRLGLLDRELGVAEQLLGILARRASARRRSRIRPGSPARDSLNGAAITSWMRSAAASASSTPRRSETSTPNSLPPVRASMSPARSAEISRRAKVISNSSPARLPIDFVDPAEAQHVDDQHGMLAGRAAALARLFDRLGEGQAVGQAGQAVAQHLGAQRALGLDLDGAVDDAEQAARPRLLSRGSGASLIRK